MSELALVLSLQQKITLVATSTPDLTDI